MTADPWNRFWYRNAEPAGLIGARVLLAGNALWIVLSRPGLATLRSWPEVFWSPIDDSLRHRFLIFDSTRWMESGLFGLLVLALVGCLLGLAPRICCFISAVLLYHFAPFEDILASTGGPFFHGLTVPVTGLFILSFAEHPRLQAPRSADWRWPLAAIQVLFAFTYLFSGLTKLLQVGPAWVSGGQFRGILLGRIYTEMQPFWTAYIVEQDLLHLPGAIAGIAMDLSFVLAVFSKRIAKVIIPVVAAAHVLIYLIIGAIFLNVPLLLLFLDWDWIQARWFDRRASEAMEPA